jgi:hypothetical protein
MKKCSTVILIAVRRCRPSFEQHLIVMSFWISSTQFPHLLELGSPLTSLLLCMVNIYLKKPVSELSFTLKSRTDRNVGPIPPINGSTAQRHPGIVGLWGESEVRGKAHPASPSLVSSPSGAQSIYHEHSSACVHTRLHAPGCRHTQMHSPTDELDDVDFDHTMAQWSREFRATAPHTTSGPPQTPPSKTKPILAKDIRFKRQTLPV